MRNHNEWNSESASTQQVEINDDGWLERLKVFAFLTIYVTGLWGQAGTFFPEPLDGWHNIPYQIFGQWWDQHALPMLPYPEHIALFNVAVGYLFALAGPLLALGFIGIGARRSGLGRPRTQGIPITVFGIVITLPVGFWLATVTKDPWGSILFETLEFLTIVPEHFLVFGVLGVLLLPGHQLALASESFSRASASFFTVMAAGLLFGLIHIGTPALPELIASFPLGVLFATMTFMSGSIWPAIASHFTLNIFPMALLPSG